MGNTKMINVTVGEVIHLFEVMKKYEVTCNLEFNTEESSNPLIGISDMPVNVEYFIGSVDGDSVIVKLGDADFSFDLRNHSYSKDVTDCQINICIASDGYAAWFNSNVIPAEGIEEANSYVEYEESVDMKIELNVMDDVNSTSGGNPFEDGLQALRTLLQEGRVIKGAHVIGDGNQVLTVGFYDEDPDHE